jgi:sulfate transport system permease protein
VASLLALLALVTLGIKSVVEWQHERTLKATAELPPERPDPSAQSTPVPKAPARPVLATSAYFT